MVAFAPSEGDYVKEDRNRHVPAGLLPKGWKANARRRMSQGWRSDDGGFSSAERRAPIPGKTRLPRRFIPATGSGRLSAISA